MAPSMETKPIIREETILEKDPVREKAASRLSVSDGG